MERKKVVVTKEELVDILYQKNNEISYPDQKIISKEEISNIIDYIIAVEEKDNKIYRYGSLPFMGKLYKDYNGTNLSKNFQSTYFFKINNDKYIYICPNLDLGFPEAEKDVINQLDYIINNNLNEKKYKDYLFHLKRDYEENINEYKGNNKTPEEKFKEYDYIKIICSNLKNGDIGIKDIKKCINFLGYNSNNKKFLTLNEEVALYLIVLFGTKNLYLNASNYYKEIHKDYINSIIIKIERYIQFIKDNKKKIVKETKYSFDHADWLNLYDLLNNSIINVPKYKIIEENTFEYLSATLKLILFEYYISNHEYEKAKNIYENSIKFYLYLDYEQSHNELFTHWFMDLDNFKFNDIINAPYDFFKKNELAPFIKRNIKIILKFYICVYYYYKYFNDDKNAKIISNFLMYFRNGFEIEDFIIKLKFYKLADEVLKIKTGNIDDIDKTIEEINERIKELIKVDQFDVENVPLDYTNINFDNLDNRVKTYIATGDKIVQTFDNRNDDFDYSCAVIEWSKAVELELNKKFISKLTYEEKCTIEKYSKERNPNQKKDFKLDLKNATIGFYKAIKDYNLQDYLYDNYFSNIYTFDKKTYNDLCQYMRDIHDTRNNSAHKEKSIEYKKAEECKEKILKSNMILEILSKLEKKH